MREFFRGRGAGPAWRAAETCPGEDSGAMKFTDRLRAALPVLLLAATAVVAQVAIAPTASAVTGSGPWPGAPAGTQAANQLYGYPYANAPDCNETTGANCAGDQWYFYQGQCTSWVAYRLNQLTGVGFNDYYRLTGKEKWGNAGNWVTAAHEAGITVNDTPAVGSVAWWPNGDGHVAIVEQVKSPTDIVDLSK